MPDRTMKYWHITLELTEERRRKSIHFLKAYTDEEYAELQDEDGDIDWEEVFDSSIETNTTGYDIDMDCEEIAKTDYDKTLEDMGWTWVEEIIGIC